MKRLTTLIIITFLAISTQHVLAQKVSKTETIVVKVSTQCEQCKARLEKAMAYEKGVTSSNLNIEKAELTVTYKPTKISPEKIRLAISEVGYDADDIKANEKAYNNLPTCCQKGGHK